MGSKNILLINLALFAIIVLAVPFNVIAQNCPAGQSPYTYTDPNTGVSGTGCAPSGQVTPQGTLQGLPGSLPNTGGQTGAPSQSTQQVNTQTTLPNPLAANDISQLINSIADWLLTIGLTLSTLVIIYSAVQFMVSGGNKTVVESARKTIWYAVIGIIVLLLAKGIALIIQGFLGG